VRAYCPHDHEPVTPNFTPSFVPRPEPGTQYARPLRACFSQNPCEAAVRLSSEINGARWRHASAAALS
jgi:hypothetical protein